MKHSPRHKSRVLKSTHAQLAEQARQSIKRLELRMGHMDDITASRANWTIGKLKKQYDL